MKAAKQKLKLDDDGFALLGNALLLGYLKNMVEYRHYDAPTKADLRRVELQNASERVELRDVLDLGGALGDWVYGPHDPRPGAEFRRLSEVYAQILNEVNADTPLARLRLKDIDFTDDHQRLFGIGNALKNANMGEMRLPMAKLGPTYLTRCVRDMVLSYFRSKTTDADLWLASQVDGVPGATIASVPAVDNGGPRSPAKATEERQIVNALRELQEAHPGHRLTRSTVDDALSGRSLGLKARNRIWHGIELKDQPRSPGATSKATPKFTAEMVLACLPSKR